MIRVHRTIELSLAVENTEQADELIEGAVNFLAYASEDDERVLEVTAVNE